MTWEGLVRREGIERVWAEKAHLSHDLSAFERPDDLFSSFSAFSPRMVPILPKIVDEVRSGPSLLDRMERPARGRKVVPSPRREARLGGSKPHSIAG